MTCQKVPYQSRTAAISAALRSSKSFGKGIRIYPCTECHALHLTTKTKSRPNPSTRRPNR